MSNDRFFDGFSENDLCFFLGLVTYMNIMNLCFVNYGASPSKLNIDIGENPPNF